MTKSNEKRNLAHILLKMPFVYKSVQSLLGRSKTAKFIYGEFIQAEATDKVLDIGCGPARKRNLLTISKYVGLDFNQRHITEASQKYPEDTFICCDVRDIDTARFGRFDKILMIGVMHHLSDEVVVETLEGVKNLLNDKGQFLSVDPVFVRNQNIVAKILAHMDQGNHVRYASHYERLVEAVFPRYEILIRNGLLRFPYNHSLIRAFAS